ncbi:uncharacterized protein EV420DRAFT_1695666 [Desarmillaria tabescens]|uniref:Retroviral polymerase SH3-like domain-containing protein n=1 Tax=Armillaria tabescens TaxID=1929756 RepID=A0AA39K427_ARMTA|nr:uncharacterized protein EV420DRAFT_1695666 [Desarmillaria tabescens]KAK0454206.1 hypothetical protein EV420DRAFT_1695666 [Desarmillaria tabescens]
MKLGGRVWEGRWIGFDETSNGSCIYWPESKMVSIEQNIYFDKSHAPADDLEGEEDIELREILSTPKAQPNLPTVKPPQTMPNPEAQPTVQPVVEETCSQCTRKPSQWVLDLISGKGSVSACQSDPVVPIGVQLPAINKNDVPLEFEGEGEADWLMLLEDAEFLEEYTMAISVADAEALVLRVSNFSQYYL